MLLRMKGPERRSGEADERVDALANFGVLKNLAVSDPVDLSQLD